MTIALNNIVSELFPFQLRLFLSIIIAYTFRGCKRLPKDSMTFSFPSFTNFSFYVIIETIVTNQGQSRHKME